MTLRLIRSESDQNGLSTGFAISQTCPDNWLIRAVKLIPGESIAFYGVGAAILSSHGVTAWPFTLALAILSILLTILCRFSATRDALNGQAQWISVGIAVMTTLFCILALELPHVLDPGFEILPAMIALAWIIVVPLCYKGNTS